MNFNEYQNLCKKTAKLEDTQRDQRLNWALGLAGEAGEYCEQIKKWAFHGKDINEVSVMSELGDILWYAAMAAHSMGFTLDEIAEYNISKLVARYPDGFKLGGGIRPN